MCQGCWLFRSFGDDGQPWQGPGRTTPTRWDPHPAFTRSAEEPGCSDEASFALHLLGGASECPQEPPAHGQPTPSTFAALAAGRFWFESLQSGQSDFLALGSLIVLSIFLRRRGLPESKPIAATRTQTGN